MEIAAIVRRLFRTDRSVGRPIWLPVLAVVSAACADSSEKASREITVTPFDSAGVRVVTIEGPVGALPEWSLPVSGQRVIRGDEPPYFGSIGEGVFLHDGSLLVEDNQSGSLWQFAGPAYDSPVHISGRGDGPGEFQNLTELSVARVGTVAAFDRRVQRVTYLGLDGAPVQSLDLSRVRPGGSIVLDAWPLSDPGRLVLEGYGAAQTESTTLPRRVYRDVVLGIYDLDQDTVARSIAFLGGYLIESESGESPAPFAPDRSIAVRGEAIVHTSGERYEIHLRNSNLELGMLIRWNDWTRALTEEEVGQARKSMESSMRSFFDAQPDIANELLEARFAEGLMPDQRPAIGRVMLDELNRIWVSDFLPTTSRGDEGRAWHVLSASGHPQAVVPLPPESRLLAVGADRIAFVSRGELDVQHVTVATLENQRR